MMNRKIVVLGLASLMSICSLHLPAAETTTKGSAVPPAAVPGINQAQGSESNEEKANKKGEEASGSNSGADSETMENESEPTETKGEAKKGDGNSAG